MKILLVEDDPGIARFVSRGLDVEGLEVEWVRRGREAPARLLDRSFSVAILDLGLPDIDGLDLCRRLRHSGVDTPILMLTARQTLEERLEGFAAGADDYLAKPFAFEELLARLNALDRRKAGRVGNIVEVGRLRLDLSLKTASIGGKLLRLSAREFDVLSGLARTPDQAVSRQQILDLAWGPDAVVSANGVDVYIGYLRRRLIEFADGPRIKTVRGVGFQLVRGWAA